MATNAAVNRPPRLCCASYHNCRNFNVPRSRWTDYYELRATMAAGGCPSDSSPFSVENTLYSGKSRKRGSPRMSHSARQWSSTTSVILVHVNSGRRGSSELFMFTAICTHGSSDAVLSKASLVPCDKTVRDHTMLAPNLPTATSEEQKQVQDAASSPGLSSS